MHNHDMSALHTTVVTTQNRLKNLLVRHTMDESNTIRVIIDPIISALGWDLLDIQQVVSEYRHKPSDNPVDYALFSAGRPVLFIEAKALSKNLDDRKWISQTINYANTANVEWTVLTNGAEWRVYKTHARVEADEKLFYTTNLTQQSAEDVVTHLAPLCKHKFDKDTELSTLWESAMVDSKIRAVLDHMHSDASIVRAFTKATKLSPADVKRGLERIVVIEQAVRSRGIFPTDITSLSTTTPTLASSPHRVQEDQPIVVLTQPADTAHPAESKERPRWTGIGMQDLLDAGMIAVGDYLYVRNHMDHPAVVLDGRFCQYNDQTFSYSAWGKEVTQWKAFQVMTSTVTQQDELLQDLRLKLDAQRHPEEQVTAS